MPADDPRLSAFAKENRRRSDPTAKRVWLALRDRRIQGQKWRREEPIGPFIVDFFCASARLAFEIDGDSHGDRQEYDAQRDDYLRAHEIEVIRVTTAELMSRWDDVMEHLAATAERRIERRKGDSENARSDAPPDGNS